MKSLRIVFVAAGIAFSAIAYSQTDTTTNPLPSDTSKPKPGKPNKPAPDQQLNSIALLQDNNTTNAEMVAVADTGGTNTTQVTPQPNFGRYNIPVLGSYAASTQSEEQNKNVTIQGDEQNAGKIWIEGLTAEKIYALRKSGAGIYKIPAQKVNETSIPEGTVLYDDNSKEVRICIGKKFVDSNPSEAFTMQSEETVTKKNKRVAEKKAPVISFTGTKTESGTAKM